MIEKKLMSPKVSIIILVYNASSYIERCARSLFEQSLKEIEYIFVNDCTSDDSMEKLEKLIAKYPERAPYVKTVNLEKNSGQAVARRKGIEQATGDYIIHCDSDDWVESCMYEEMYDYAINNKCDVVKCDFYRENAIYTRVCKQFSQEFYNDKYDVISKLILGSELSSLVDKLVHRSIVHDPTVIYPVHNMQEDYVLSLQYFLKSKKIGYIKKPFYYYCYNQISTSHAPNEDATLKRLNDVCENSKLIISILEKNKLVNKYKDEIACLKFNDRCHVLDLIGRPHIYKIWRNTFPEIDRDILFNSKMNKKLKLQYLVVRMHLFPLSQKLYNKFCLLVK